MVIDSRAPVKNNKRTFKRCGLNEANYFLMKGLEWSQKEQIATHEKKGVINGSD